MVMASETLGASGGASLFERLREGAGPLWQAYVGHEFVRGLVDGTLPAASFRQYLVQDYLFLVHFVRAHALAGYKSTQLDDLEDAAAGMSALLAEMKLHVAYCAEWGIDPAAMAATTEAVETIGYTRYVFERGTAGDLLDLHVVLAPCIMGYAEIGVAARPGARAGNPYAAWIEAYAGDGLPGGGPQRGGGAGADRAPVGCDGADGGAASGVRHGGAAGDGVLGHGLAGQRPVNTGVRFSMKAVRPSR